MSASDIQHALQLLQQGDISNARGVLERLVGKIPVYVAAQVALAKVYELEGRWDDAYEAWVRSSELLPTNTIIVEGLQRASLRRSSEYATRAYTETSVAADTVEVDAPPAEIGTETAVEKAEFEAPTVEVVLPEETPVVEVATDEITIDPPSPESRSAAVPEESSVDTSDLDTLIDQLDDARIVPREDFDSIPEPNLEPNTGTLASETLAKIFESQSQYGEAARVYDQLAIQQPDKATDFQAKAEKLRKQTKG